MEAMTLRQLVAAVGGTPLGDFYDPDQTVTDVDTDSRNLHPGCLFLPLEGERFDAHSFISGALENGAAGCLTAREREKYLPGKFYIKVKNTQKALRDLAKYYRDQFDIPFIGVTGSVGKTTTKEMIAAVLSEKFSVHKTELNFNNEVGLPLSLLSLNHTHQISVTEMGMNHFGEIDYLADIVEPEVALITNIGDSHIEFLGSRENILKAKCEIFPHMKKGGLAILNGDDPLLCSLKGKLPCETLYCGKAPRLDYVASDLEHGDFGGMHCKVKTLHTTCDFDIPALGDHMIYPVLMAAAVGEHFGMTAEEIARGVLRFAPTKMRMNLIDRADGIRILNDSYNANPQSMRAAVEVLAGSRSDYKVAVLGDMFELGALAAPLHAGVGQFLAKSGIDCLVAIGDLARHIYDAAETAQVPEVYWFATREEALPVLRQVVKKNATILVKASRGMAFEKIVEDLKGMTQDP
ncbi:MAG: UDP-N-acetylmuramoyl-tripeptide--D-alanyl-D-alanine ligase [Oscillospiraceae bacterium]